MFIVMKYVYFVDAIAIYKLYDVKTILLHLVA
ncbi:hypothetical protein ACJIZ3_014567 [Penstemon smallii]|uniref:Uncharacterized protein n=1 Tax=Penstemon smallii TaxID=265156 RepID=A0ABD3RKQ5_9LAMI